MSNDTVDVPATNYTAEALLDKVNDEFANAILPATIVLGIESVVGFIGNFLVIIVYTKYYDRSNFKYFVLFLAYTDITSCMTCIPGEVFTQLNWYKLSYDWLCKSKVFFNIMTTWNSASILLLFSFDRFRKICYPMRWQMRPYLARRMCICLTIATIIAVAPNPVGWEIKTYETASEYGPVNVTSCGKSDEYPDAVYTFLLYFYFLVILLMMVLITLLNIMTARKVICGKRLPPSASTRAKSRSPMTDTSVVVSTVTRSLPSHGESRGAKKTKEGNRNEAYDNKAYINEDRPTTSAKEHHDSAVHKEPNSSESKPSIVGGQSAVAKKAKLGNGRSSRKLVIMFVVTMVFVITMTVYLVVTLYLIPNLSTPSLSNAEKVLFFSAWRLYFVNYMFNPFLYGVMDQRFRTALGHLFCKR